MKNNFVAKNSYKTNKCVVHKSKKDKARDRSRVKQELKKNLSSFFLLIFKGTLY